MSQRSRLFDVSFRFTSTDVRRLFRKHGHTIATVARAMGIPQRSVRRWRNDGVCGYTACDMFEAVTGSLSPRMRAAFLSSVSAD